jgi:hypothetical protein
MALKFQRVTPMALYRLACALGHQSLVTMLIRSGLAHLYNLVPYQRRAVHAGQRSVEVEGGRVPDTRLVPQRPDPRLEAFDECVTFDHESRWNV